MDPISASNFNLNTTVNFHQQYSAAANGIPIPMIDAMDDTPSSIEENSQAIKHEQKQEEQFSEIVVSCRSLSSYESSKFRTLMPQIFASIVAASFHIVVGISLAFSAILIPQLEEDTGDALKITKFQSSLIASAIVLVVPVGAITGGFIMESLGRLNTIKLAAIPAVIGWTMMAMADNFPVLLIGRLLTGLASAFGTSPAIVYITEIARADMRGSLISAAPTYASLGMVLAYMKGWYMSWRTVAWLCNIYSIVPAFLLVFIPESAVWLVSKGRYEKAAITLDYIHKYQPHPDRKTETFAELHLNALIKEHELKLAVQMSQREAGTGNTMARVKEFLKPTGYKPILILSGLFIFQQFSGIYITLFYAVTFFQEVDRTIDPYLASIGLGLVRLFMSMVNTWLLRTYRRRPLIITSAFGMTICMFLSGLFTKLNQEGTTNLNWVPLVCLLMYVVTSMIGLLGIPWTMTAELFPTEIRGIAHGISYSLANLIMFAAVQLYRDMNEFFGGAYALQWFFASVSLAGALYSFIFLPETHGKKLSDIQIYFIKNTVYLGQKKEDTQPPEKKKKPIVKSTRVEESDITKAKQGQTEKMISNDV